MIKIVTCVLLVSCATLLGQTFEVASVKPADPDSQGGIINYRNGTFHATGITAKNCIALAYDFPSFQLAGGPGWIGEQRYDIVAKMPAGANRHNCNCIMWAYNFQPFQIEGAPGAYPIWGIHAAFTLSRNLQAGIDSEALVGQVSKPAADWQSARRCMCDRPPGLSPSAPAASVSVPRDAPEGIVFRSCECVMFNLI
jgi:hypothetical protein